MSAVIISVQAHRAAAYVLSDAGVWSLDGKLVDIRSKIHRLSNCIGITIGNGSCQVQDEFNAALGSLSFDECVALAPKVLSASHTRMFLVGVSERTRREQAWLVTAEGVTPIMKLCTPTYPNQNINERLRDPAVDGLILMEKLRITPSSVPWGKDCVVRGFCELATITKAGVKIETLKHWPDQITPEVLSDPPHRVRAEEMLFTDIDTAANNNRVITIDSSINNINLRALHDSIYPVIVPDQLGYNGITVTFIINTGAIVGSDATSLKAIDVGTWLPGFVPNLHNLGRIQGAAGNGGAQISGDDETPGSPGGIALYTRHPINLIDETGEIWGGGGGGGAGRGGGGGGAGTVPGAGGSDPAFGFPGSPGTSEAGGVGGGVGGPGGKGGDGGGPGLVGQAGTNIFGIPSGPGGAPGVAIDGISFVTTIGPDGDRRGGQVN